MNDQQFKNLKEKVEYCLEYFSETRDSDITLLIFVWEYFFNVKEVVCLSSLYTLPREDHISRIRRKIQNDHNRWLPTKWEIAKRRGIEEIKWKKALGYYVEDAGQLVMDGT